VVEVARLESVYRFI